MSASSTESPDSNFEKSYEKSQTVESNYVLYLFSNNKHARSPDNSTDKENITFQKIDTKVDYDEPSVCLSLLEGNLEAEQETVVRCYLLKTLSSREDSSFENEGKYAELQFSDGSFKSFGCYYHRLSKHSSPEKVDLSDGSETSKLHTFLICLIGPANGIMESFCTDLGKFCFSLIPLLDPEGLENINDVKIQLKSWYSHCIEYISRCIQRFKDVVILLHCSLWGNVEIICEDEDLKWDIERFVETSSLLHNSPEYSTETSFKNENNFPIIIKVEGDRILPLDSFGDSPYCAKWCEKLRKCSDKGEIALHSTLEEFRLKTIQDLNTLKRFLQKAQTDHYSLYKALLFLQASGYAEILLYHVEREADMAGDQDILEIISCLKDFLKHKCASSKQSTTK